MAGDDAGQIRITGGKLVDRGGQRLVGQAPMDAHDRPARVIR